jgi:hypothetical protein
MITCGPLLKDIPPDDCLSTVILPRVRMTAVNDDTGL